MSARCLSFPEGEDPYSLSFPALNASHFLPVDDRVQVFYELADGSGWVFKVLPEGGRECVEELNPPGSDGSLCRIM